MDSPDGDLLGFRQLSFFHVLCASCCYVEARAGGVLENEFVVVQLEQATLQVILAVEA
jgi:hypothetical protein